MGCHGNHAFSHSQNKFQDKCFFSHSGGLNENLSPLRTCPGDWGSCWSNKPPGHFPSLSFYGILIID